ncbi:ComEC/Rec2 family competence protein [Arthrobacter sp. NPDC055138]
MSGARWQRYADAARRPVAAGPEDGGVPGGAEAGDVLGSRERGAAMYRGGGSLPAGGQRGAWRQLLLKHIKPEPAVASQGETRRLDLRLGLAAASCWAAALVLPQAPIGVALTTAALLLGGACAASARLLLPMSLVCARCLSLRRMLPKIRPSPADDPLSRRRDARALHHPHRLHDVELGSGLRRTRRLRRGSGGTGATAVVLVLCSCTGLLALMVGVQQSQRLAGPIEEAIVAEETITARLVASGDASRVKVPGQFGSGPRFNVKATIVEATAAGTRFEADTPVLVLGGPDWSGVRYGERLRASGKLARADSGQAVEALLIASTAPADRSAPPLDVWVSGLRAQFVKALEPLPPDARGLLPGMVLGDKEHQGDDLEDAMRRTGLTHLLTVSGANVSYVLGFVYLLASAVRLPRWLKAVVGVASLAGFVLLVRPEPSVLRAAVMGSIGVAAVLSGRRRASLSFLALAVLVLLVMDPWLAANYSFVLSVLATLSLVLLGSACSRWLQPFLPVPLAHAVAMPMAAQVFCAPVIVQLQPELALYSIPANVAAGPVVPFITIAGMVGTALLPLLPAVGGLVLHTAGSMTLWVAGVARWFSELPLAAVPWAGGPVGAAGAAAAGLALLWGVRRVAGGRSGTDRRPEDGPPEAGTGLGRCGFAARGRIFRLACWTAVPALLAGAAAGLLASILGPGGPPRSWDVAACDVGQGDGLVVRTGERSAIVVDAGPETDLMGRCLDGLGVEQIDVLVLTHMHLDHYGGIDGVLAGRQTERVLYSSAKEALPEVVRASLQAHGLKAERAASGQTGSSGAAEWTVHWPVHESAGLSENDSSLVVEIKLRVDTGGEVRMLLTGDLEQEQLPKLTRRLGPDFTVDVLKISHHGARNGGTALITGLRPAAALISVGAENDYGHPAAEILSALRTAGVQVLRTDQLGTVLLDADGGKLSVLTGR